MQQTWRAKLRALSEEGGGSGSSSSQTILDASPAPGGPLVEAKGSDQIPTSNSMPSAIQGTSESDSAARRPFSTSGEKPKLSICLITYNRSRYLRKTLTDFFATANFPFDYELLICDNCSTDDTPDVIAEFAQVHPQIRYIRQKRNVGAEANLIGTYRMARGAYVVYQADDDRLVPEAVAQVVDYMDRHPDVGVCHCPWEFWDDVDQQSIGLFYSIDAPMQFDRKDSLALCDLILQNHIFPEVCVYRAEVLRRMIYLPRSAYWAFVHLIDVLDYGKVAFLPFSYYRTITRHWPGEHRQQAGHAQTMSDWDTYRGGLELMIHRAFLLQGQNGVPENQRETVAGAVNLFINKRMRVALRLLIGSEQFIAAHAVMVRLFVANALTDNEAQTMRDILVARAGLQALIQAFEANTTLECIGLYEVSDPAAMKTVLRQLQPNLTIVDLDTATTDGPGNDRMLVLTRTRDSRKALLDAGHHPGFVMVEQDLAWVFAS
jgi:glycosyltransferase involved in cell wall biosynthesis